MGQTKDFVSYHPPCWTRKQKIEFRRKRKKAKKKLIKAAKRFRPYDYGFILDLVDIALEDFEDFYSSGIYVLQVDESRCEIASSIKEARAKLSEYYDKESSPENDPAQKKIEEFFALLGKYIRTWWD